MMTAARGKDEKAAVLRKGVLKDPFEDTAPKSRGPPERDGTGSEGDFVCSPAGRGQRCWKLHGVPREASRKSSR